jgi:hypothetical protein
MSIQKLLQLVTGKRKEYAGLDSSAGVGSAGHYIALDSNGKINANMMPSGIGPEQVSVTAATALAQWNLVNTYLDGVTLKARKADAGTNKYKAIGFCPEIIENAAEGNIQTDGYITCVGFTPGEDVYLSDTPGTVTQTPVSGTGKIHQKVGFAISPTQWAFAPEEDIELA